MMRVRVLPPDGIVCATAPRWTSRKAVIEFLSERYNWMQKLSVVANLSWQDARDRQKYKSDGKQSVTYNNHVPNRCYCMLSIRNVFRWLYQFT